jgi:hypothetical protein
MVDQGKELNVMTKMAVKLDSLGVLLSESFTYGSDHQKTRNSFSSD